MILTVGIKTSVILGVVLLLWGEAASASTKDLWKAAKRGETAEVTEILASGIDVNSADRKDRTALMMASERGHVETVETLLNSGADPTLRDRKRRYAVNLARDKGHASVVELLRFAMVSKSNTESGFVGFLEEYPGSQYTDAANKSLHTARWTAASTQDDSAAYKAFIESYPDSEFVPNAKSRLETLDWQLLANDQKSTSQDYQSFLVKYPATVHSTDAIKKIEFLQDRESRMSEDGRIRIGNPSTISADRANKLLVEVLDLIQPLTLGQLAGDDVPHGQSNGGGISVGGGAFSAGTTSVTREDGITVMAMSARQGSAQRPNNVGVWHLPPGATAVSAMFGGSSGKIALRLSEAFENDANPFRFKRVRTYTLDQELEYTFDSGTWTMQRYEKTEE